MSATSSHPCTTLPGGTYTVTQVVLNTVYFFKLLYLANPNFSKSEQSTVRISLDFRGSNAFLFYFRFAGCAYILVFQLVFSLLCCLQVQINYIISLNSYNECIIKVKLKRPFFAIKEEVGISNHLDRGENLHFF